MNIYYVGYIRFHIHKMCTFRVTKISLNISDHVRFQQDSIRMIGQDNRLMAYDWLNHVQSANHASGIFCRNLT